MRIYFSGGRGLKTTPEFLIPELAPHIMLTFHDIQSNGTRDRLNVYFKSHGLPLLKRTGKSPKPIVPKGLYTESMFMDSGAFSLYNLHVRPKLERGEWPKEPRHYTFYSLKPGSEFRKYCDKYARWVKHYKDAGILWTTVDAIRGPKASWEAQQYFENEHGIQPVPVIHAKTPLKWVEHYLSTGKYDLIGLGGLGQNTSIGEYETWASNVFEILCPKSNGRKPLVRVHGFAMTSAKLIQRYPWWSVDSATWVKLSAYGWLYIPRLKRNGKWDFDSRPIQLNVSAKSPQAGKHLRSLIGKNKVAEENILAWLDELELDLGSVQMTPEEEKTGAELFTDEELGVQTAGDGFEEDSLSGHFVNRSRANLHYMKGLEKSRPEWPHPLNERVLNRVRELGV